MYETSVLLLLKYLIFNIILPFFPGLLFIWIFYGDKFKGVFLYLFSWFLGIWVIASSLFNIQFFHFGIGVAEYFIVLGVLLLIFVGKVFIGKQTIGYYIQTLKIKNNIPLIKKSFLSLTLFEKILAVIISMYSIYFVSISGMFNFNLPTYAPDALWNRNKFVYNIYADGGIKIFGDESEILGRGRLGYPIFVPAYKVMISKFVGSINDIYLNVWQWLLFVFGLLFVFFITFEKTKNIFKSVLPIGLIISLPLVFFHSFEGNLDLSMIFYCIIAAWLFYQYLESKDFDCLSLGLLFGFIVSNIKNDGLIVFFPGLLMALFIILCLNRELLFTIKGFFRDKNNLLKSVGYLIYFLIPFLVVKRIHGLGFNQAGYLKSGIGWSEKIHREILPVIKQCFFGMDNYNLILIIMLFVIVASIGKNRNDRLFIYAGVIIFLILMAVFLFTVDYQFVMDQTTVNRMFTLCFIMILAFSGFIFNRK